MTSKETTVSANKTMGNTKSVYNQMSKNAKMRTSTPKRSPLSKLEKTPQQSEYEEDSNATAVDNDANFENSNDIRYVSNNESDDSNNESDNKQVSDNDSSDENNNNNTISNKNFFASDSQKDKDLKNKKRTTNKPKINDSLKNSETSKKIESPKNNLKIPKTGIQSTKSNDEKQKINSDHDVINLTECDELDNEQKVVNNFKENNASANTVINKSEILIIDFLKNLDPIRKNIIMETLNCTIPADVNNQDEIISIYFEKLNERMSQNDEYKLLKRTEDMKPLQTIFNTINYHTIDIGLLNSQTSNNIFVPIYTQNTIKDKKHTNIHKTQKSKKAKLDLDTDTKSLIDKVRNGLSLIDGFNTKLEKLETESTKILKWDIDKLVKQYDLNSQNLKNQIDSIKEKSDIGKQLEDLTSKANKLSNNFDKFTKQLLKDDKEAKDSIKHLLLDRDVELTLVENHLLGMINKFNNPIEDPMPVTLIKTLDENKSFINFFKQLSNVLLNKTANETEKSPSVIFPIIKNDLSIREFKIHDNNNNAQTYGQRFIFFKLKKEHTMVLDVSRWFDPVYTAVRYHFISEMILNLLQNSNLNSEHLRFSHYKEPEMNDSINPRIWTKLKKGSDHAICFFLLLRKNSDNYEFLLSQHDYPIQTSKLPYNMNANYYKNLNNNIEY